MAHVRVGTLLLAALLGGGCVRPMRPESLPAADRGTAYLKGPPLEPVLVARIRAIALSDDDGGRPTNVDEAQVARWVAFANDIYRPAGIRFEFSAAKGDLMHIKNTALNSLDVHTDWARMEKMGNQVSALLPDRLVVFFRHGADEDATGAGFAGSEYDFVVMPGEERAICGHEYVAQLAHQLGHHLGLEHTNRRSFWIEQQAADYLRQKNRDPSIFDGDRLADTPPDPGIRARDCENIAEVDLDGLRLTLPRRNLMSGYEEADSLTAQQAERARWFLAHRLAHQMKMPTNVGTGLVEAEELAFAAREDCGPWVQDMKPFGVGRFGGDAQIFCSSRTPRPGAFAVTLPVARAGRYRLDLYLTQAPDYGIVEVTVDGRLLGGAYDAWAPWVMPSGPVPLGERVLSAGKHELVFRARRKNDLATAYNLGVDALGLVPLP
jgi:hypothetical protein